MTTVRTSLVFELTDVRQEIPQSYEEGDYKVGGRKGSSSSSSSKRRISSNSSNSSSSSGGGG